MDSIKGTVFLKGTVTVGCSGINTCSTKGLGIFVSWTVMDNSSLSGATGRRVAVGVHVDARSNVFVRVRECS